MSDKAKNSHIERTVYVSPDVTPGSSLRYGSWEDREDLAKRCGNCYGSGTARDNSRRDVRCDVCRGTGRVKPLPLTIIEYATGSDYSGSLVERSNFRVLQRDFPWLVEIYGGHGTQGLAYLGRRENQNDALIEAIDSLADYPLLDESDHSELECETEDEAWSDYGESDFVCALNEYLDEIDPDYEHEVTDETIKACALPRRHYPDCLDSVWALWREGVDAFNVNGGSGCANEQGDSIHFYIDEWIDSATKPVYPGWSDSFKAAHDHMRTCLARIARASRTTEDSNV